MRDDEDLRESRAFFGRTERWIRTATAGSDVRRAAGYGIVVSAVLIMINHGDAIFAGRVDASRVLKMTLTVLVPYCVSIASSVGAMLERPSLNPVETATRSR